jgi:hypothetical protein
MSRRRNGLEILLFLVGWMDGMDGVIIILFVFMLVLLIDCGHPVLSTVSVMFGSLVGAPL